MATDKCPSLPTEPDKPCIVRYFTQNDRMNEPPPQPRVRKVTTIVNTLGVIVRNTAKEIGVWVLTACIEKSIPKEKPHMFMGFTVGVWIIVGVYPDGTIASFSPWPLILKAYETIESNGCLRVKRLASELEYEKMITYGDAVYAGYSSVQNLSQEPDLLSVADLYMINGFGRILVPIVYRQFFEERKESAFIWIQYCRGIINGCDWYATCPPEVTNPVDSVVKENDLRGILEFLRERPSPNELDVPPLHSVTRHFGLITDVFKHKHLLHCWASSFSSETDHSAKVPQPPKHREIECEMLPPLIGQWIQFDMKPEDKEIYLKTKGQKLSIQEYLPINSPCGIGVVHTNKTLRVMISCVLVMGTDHPWIYNLPIFGNVIDQKASLVSGSHMQLLLEKTKPKLRKQSGLCWKVIDSLVVNVSDVTIEKINEMNIENVPLKDSMEVSYFIPVEKIIPASQNKTNVTSSNNSCGLISSTTGITNLKYQQPAHPSHPKENKKEFFIGSNVNGRLTATSSQPSRNSTRWAGEKFPGDKLEGCVLVERITPDEKNGIAWHFDSVHFLYDDTRLTVGDYAYVKFDKKTDPCANHGYRWVLKSETKRNPPFVCFTDGTRVNIEDQLTYVGYHNQQKRHYYRSSLFTSVFDFDNLITNPSAGFCYFATLCRRKMGLYSRGFSWVIRSLQGSTCFKPSFSNSSSNYCRNNVSKQVDIATSAECPTEASSDHSSKSPPLKSLPPSDED